MNQWVLLAIVVITTTGGEVLQSIGMKKHGEIDDFSGRGIARVARRLMRNWYIPVSILLMAVSFFGFLQLLRISDLSFAVPATAASLVIETVLAKYLLKEWISPTRWAGTLCVACGVALLAV